MAGNAGETISASAATGVAIGTAIPGIGNVIGGAVGAIVGTLTLFKGKTAHLDFTAASNIAKSIAEKVNDPIIKLFGYNSATYSAYGKALAAEALKKVQARQNSASKSWQYWIGNAIADLQGRAVQTAGDPGGTIYVYTLYVAMNYDASNPAEFEAVLKNDLVLIMTALTGRFPESKPIVEGAAAAGAAVAGSAPTTSASNFLGQSTGGSKPAPAPATMAPADADKEAQGKTVLIAGFAILAAGFLLFTRKGKK
jgi:hypothetical protein